MTTIALPAASIAPARKAVPILGLIEARRFLLHPVVLLGFGWAVVMLTGEVIAGTFIVQRFEAVTSGLSFFLGVPCILAGHMIATRDLRADTTDLLATTPCRTEERIRALCLAALAPALVALALNLALTGYFLATGGFDLGVPPGLWHTIQAPITVFGGALLGIMLGVWFPSRATPVIAMVSMVAVNIWLHGHSQTTDLFGPMTSWADWGPYDGSIWYALVPGSPFGHVVYLLGLCGLAATASVLRVAERRAPILTFGLATLTLTVIGGLVQLP